MITKRRFAKSIPMEILPLSGCISLHNLLYDGGHSVSVSNHASGDVTFEVRITRVESSKIVFDESGSVVSDEAVRFDEPFDVRRGDYTVNIDVESELSDEYLWKDPASSDLLIVRIYDEKIKMAAVTPESNSEFEPSTVVETGYRTPTVRNY